MAQFTLLYDGPLTWRLSRDRLINVHVVLLSDILLLLQKQDEKLALRSQSTLLVAGKTETKTTHSPIIKLQNLLVKPVATGEYWIEQKYKHSALRFFIKQCLQSSEEEEEEIFKF